MILKPINDIIYSGLSRCGTARGSSIRFSLVGPTKVKVKVRESSILTEKVPCIKNKGHLLDFVITLKLYSGCGHLIDLT